MLPIIIAMAVGTLMVSSNKTIAQSTSGATGSGSTPSDIPTDGGGSTPSGGGSTPSGGGATPSGGGGSTSSGGGATPSGGGATPSGGGSSTPSGGGGGDLGLGSGGPNPSGGGRGMDVYDGGIQNNPIDLFVYNQPIYNYPIENPVNTQPVYNEPMPDLPTYDLPVSSQPVSDQPVYVEPMPDLPNYDLPNAQPNMNDISNTDYIPETFAGDYGTNPNATNFAMEQNFNWYNNNPDATSSPDSFIWTASDITTFGDGGFGGGGGGRNISDIEEIYNMSLDDYINGKADLGNTEEMA